MPRRKSADAVKIPKTSGKNKSIPQRKVETGLSPLAIEVISIFTLAFSVLLLLSIYTQDGAGAIGHVLNNLTKGLFGFGAYVIPLIIIFVSIYMLMAEKKSFSKEQTILGTVFFIVIISFVHVLNLDPYLQYEGLFDFLAKSYKYGDYINGGLLGAFLGGFLLKIAGSAGTYIILVASGIALFILLTGYSVLEFFKSAAKQVPKPRMTEAQDPYDSKPMKVTSISSKKMTVYDVPENTSYKKKSKPLNLVVKDVEHSSDEEEIHIITGGKRFVKSPAEKKMNRTLKAVPVIDTEIKSAAALEDTIDMANALFADEDILSEREVFVEKPSSYGKLIKLNLDIADEDIPEPVEESPSVAALAPKPVLSPQPVPALESELEKEDEDEPPYDPATMPDIGGYVDEYIKEEADTAKYIPDTPDVTAEYVFPSIDFLKVNTSGGTAITSKAQVLENSKKLEDTLKSFSVEAKVIEVSVGPAVTRYELSPGQGVKVSKISGLADDLALNLAAAGIRIEAPIPGKAAVGIEVPNKEVQPVFLREVIESEDFIKFPSNVAFAIGKDIAGKTVVADIAKMPHLLIAGATGSGKSVCINTLITSIIYKSDPSEVKLLMVDPKVVELSVYNGIPHLLIPVVTDPKKAAAALNWAVKEMIARYNYFAETSVRDLKGYNNYLIDNGQPPLPQIVIIVDELADLMMVAQNEVEDAICRLAQMARAAGLHLVIATQRPSVDVITGLIKANIPSRIAFSVTSGTDSRTILDMVGAEKLLGKGDMLFYPAGLSKPIRVQGAFISDKEVESIVSFLKHTSAPPDYTEDMVEKITSAAKSDGKSNDSDQDELFVPAMDFIVKKEKASVSMLQRHLRIGYNRAARLMEEIEARGFVDEGDGSKPRNVLISPLDWDDYKGRNSL